MRDTIVQYVEVQTSTPYNRTVKSVPTRARLRAACLRLYERLKHGLILGFLTSNIRFRLLQTNQIKQAQDTSPSSNNNVFCVRVVPVYPNSNAQVDLLLYHIINEHHESLFSSLPGLRFVKQNSHGVFETTPTNVRTGKHKGR